jgi:excisionase family DNA binding protein
VTSWREKIWLRPDEAAEVLSVSKRHVQRMIAAGELPSQKSGGARVIPVAALLANEQRTLEAAPARTTRATKRTPRQQRFVARALERVV